jgi:hypothetical protein
VRHFQSATLANHAFKVHAAVCNPGMHAGAFPRRPSLPSLFCRARHESSSWGRESHAAFLASRRAFAGRTLRISKGSVPLGVSTSIRAPTRWPTRALPTGAAIDTRPLPTLGSIAPTSSYSTVLPTSRSRTRTRLPIPARPCVHVRAPLCEGKVRSDCPADRAGGAGVEPWGQRCISVASISPSASELVVGDEAK